MCDEFCYEKVILIFVHHVVSIIHTFLSWQIFLNVKKAPPVMLMHVVSRNLDPSLVSAIPVLQEMEQPVRVCRQYLYIYLLIV